MCSNVFQVHFLKACKSAYTKVLKRNILKIFWFCLCSCTLHISSCKVLIHKQMCQPKSSLLLKKICKTESKTIFTFFPLSVQKKWRVMDSTLLTAANSILGWTPGFQCINGRIQSVRKSCTATLNASFCTLILNEKKEIKCRLWFGLAKTEKRGYLHFLLLIVLLVWHDARFTEDELQPELNVKTDNDMRSFNLIQSYCSQGLSGEN